MLQSTRGGGRLSTCREAIIRMVFKLSLEMAEARRQ